MKNQEIAELLESIASLMEVDDAGWFKVQAFKNAADTIRSHPEPVAKMVEEGRDLTELQDVGKGTAARVQAMVAAGKEAYTAELEGDSPGILRLLRIPGLGPKRVSALREHLGITSVEALEVAAEQGKLSEMPGMGEKTQASMLRRIGRLREREAQEAQEDGAP